MTTTDWIPIHDVRPGDHVKVPRGSRRVWASREDAERHDAPFRTVECVEPDAEGAGTVAIWFADGVRGCYPTEAHVLRRQP